MGAMGLTSQLLLVCSLRHFSAAEASPAGRLAARRGEPVTAEVTAELLLSLVYLVSSLVGFLIVDATDTGALAALDRLPRG